MVKFHGIARSIVSDRDPKFVCYFWKILWTMLGTKLLFDTSCHRQTDWQTEVVNRTLSALLRANVGTKLKNWDECLAHIEFAYNRNVHGTTNHTTFVVVYGFNPLTPLDLAPLPAHDRVSLDGKKSAEQVRALHEKVKLRI